jgi:hypothetical protein
MKTTLIASLAASAIVSVSAECPNACNGHGKCTSYDMCDCNRNWQANDCSERVCQYGLAHVDTPKGDLNMNNMIDDAETILVENSFKYPYGTTEQFPRMQDSDLKVIDNSAHYYMECSNKGVCNRQTGTCECYPGYDGAACQRASCPGYPDSCSGHGVCKTIRQLANSDNGNIYELWDRDTTMGCECDAGFYGPDCSLRQCKSEIDPLYYDDTSTVKTAVFDFAIMSPSANGFLNGLADSSTGQWAIVMYDMFGQKWQTAALNAGASCDQVVAALNALPNDVVPTMDADTMCTLTHKATATDTLTGWDNAADNMHYTRPRPITYDLAFWSAGAITGDSSFDAASTVDYAGYIYRLYFRNNPGAIRQPEINVHLDGNRPSLASAPSVNAELVTKVWTDGQQGENIDYFGDHCSGVTATLTTATISGDVRAVLGGLDATEANLLKICLGEADFTTTGNVGIQNWDTGSIDYPHLIKLVLTTADSQDGGLYAALMFDGTYFVLFNPASSLDDTNTNFYEIYTTKGTLARTSKDSLAAFGFGSNSIITANATYEKSRGYIPYDGDLSCEVTDRNADKFSYITHCLNKSDIITFLNPYGVAGSPYINLYTINKIYTTRPAQNYTTGVLATAQSVTAADDLQQKYGTNVIETDLATNWATNNGFYAGNTEYTQLFYVYKFFPSSESSYTYVAQCSNRGICNTENGLCECFGGYTGDGCQFQSSLAV